MKKNDGVTLSELLIIVLVLGVIASFTVPKIFTNTYQDKREALIKNSFYTLYDVLHQGWLEGVVKDSASLDDIKAYIFNNLHLVKTCPNNTLSEGCYSAAGDPYVQNVPGGILPTGAVFGLRAFGGSACSPLYWITVDSNGDNPPNIRNEWYPEGTQDVYHVVFNTGRTNCTYVYQTVKPGQMIAYAIQYRNTSGVMYTSTLPK